MSKIKTSTEVSVYEINGSDDKVTMGDKVRVTSHWNDDDMCELEVNGHRVTVLRRDLIAATVRASFQP